MNSTSRLSYGKVDKKKVGMRIEEIKEYRLLSMRDEPIGWYLFTVNLIASHTYLENPTFLGNEIDPYSTEVAVTNVLAYWNGSSLSTTATECLRGV